MMWFTTAIWDSSSEEGGIHILKGRGPKIKKTSQLRVQELGVRVPLNKTVLLHSRLEQ